MQRGAFAKVLGLFLFLALLPTAEGGKDLENDPLVRLYKNRVTHSQAVKRRMVVRLGFAKQRYDRLRRLVASNSTSIEEFERAAAWYESLVVKVDEATAEIVEAETLLELCRSRLADGKDMPIIPISSGSGEDLSG